MLATWDDTLERLREIAREPPEGPALDAVRPLPPVQPLGQFLCAGANYRKHLTEIVFTMARNDPQETRPDEVLRQEAADFVHHRAVVCRRELSGDGLLHVEALAEDQGGSGHLPDYRRPAVTAAWMRAASAGPSCSRMPMSRAMLRN